MWCMQIKHHTTSCGSGDSLFTGTPREREVLGLVARGRSNPQIAQELVISRATAKTHVERIIGKLGVSDRTQAALRAIELGLVTFKTGE